jgi:hypothetical protein
MEFVVKINMDNAAFEDCPGDELERLLEHVVGELRKGVTDNSLRDINGNVVGEFAVKY